MGAPKIKRTRVDREAIQLRIYAMLDQGMSLQNVADEVGMSKSAIRSIKVKRDDKPMTAADLSTVALTKEVLNSRLNKLILAGADQVDAKISEASASQAAIIMAIGIDKQRLINDQSTSNVAHVVGSLVGKDPDDVDDGAIDV